MDKVKHEIEAALAWLEEGNLERVKLHLGFALQWRNDEASQQMRAADEPQACDNFRKARDGKCFNCGFSEAAHR